MEDSAFLSARQLAQELVRSRVEPGELAQLYSFAKENKGAAFFAHLQGLTAQAPPTAEHSTALLPTQILENHLRPLQEKPEEMLDVLGWSVDFMRYYRGEGNRPAPERRPSQPQPRRPRPSRPAKEKEATIALESLQLGQMLQGTVRSVMPYGIFVDIGAGRDGLIHISEMSDDLKREPSVILNAGESVDVWVKSVDLEKKRISLSMKDPAQAQAAPAPAPYRSHPEARPAGEYRQAPTRSGDSSQTRNAPRPDRDRDRDRDRGDRGSGAPRAERATGPSRLDAPRSEAPRRSGPRRRQEPRNTSSTIFEDETPKEMTALGEALRAALAAQQEAQEIESADSAHRRKKQNVRSEALAEAHRRTLYN